MLDKMGDGLNFQAKALLLRAERQRALAGNIANADTPGYQARDFNFAQALSQATGTSTAGTLAMSTSASQGGAAGGATLSAGMTDARHIPLGGGGSGGGYSVSTLAQAQGYSTQTQPSMDNNTVDLDRERAAFADNAVRYEATLRFINGQSKTMLSAITGQ